MSTRVQDLPVKATQLDNDKVLLLQADNTLMTILAGTFKGKGSFTGDTLTEVHPVSTMVYGNGDYFLLTIGNTTALYIWDQTQNAGSRWVFRANLNGATFITDAMLGHTNYSNLVVQTATPDIPAGSFYMSNSLKRLIGPAHATDGINFDPTVANNYMSLRTKTTISAGTQIATWTPALITDLASPAYSPQDGDILHHEMANNTHGGYLYTFSLANFNQDVTDNPTNTYLEHLVAGYGTRRFAREPMEIISNVAPAQDDNAYITGDAYFDTGNMLRYPAYVLGVDPMEADGTTPKAANVLRVETWGSATNLTGCVTHSLTAVPARNTDYFSGDYAYSVIDGRTWLYGPYDSAQNTDALAWNIANRVRIESEQIYTFNTEQPVNDDLFKGGDYQLVDSDTTLDVYLLGPYARAGNDNTASWGTRSNIRAPRVFEGNILPNAYNAVNAGGALVQGDYYIYTSPQSQGGKRTKHGPHGGVINNFSNTEVNNPDGVRWHYIATNTAVPARNDNLYSSGDFLITNSGVIHGPYVENSTDNLLAWPVSVNITDTAANTTGEFNTATGSYSLAANTTGGNNTANGAYALYGNTTGSSNTATGRNALYNNTTGSSNTASGRESLRDNTTGSFNTTNGAYSLRANTTGSSNVANGYFSLLTNTTGANNVATGRNSLTANTTGFNNVATGYYSLAANTTGVSNTATGRSALYSNTTGSFNTAIGRNALVALLSGNNNTAIGRTALVALLSGNNNTAIGRTALVALLSGNNNTAIGNEADAPTTSSSNTFTLGNASVSNLRCNDTSISSLSDARDKTDIIDLPHGLEYINALRPVEFTWDYRQEHYSIETDDDGNVLYATAPSKQGTSEVGFIAQELDAVSDALGGESIKSVHHFPAEPNSTGSKSIDVIEADYGKLLPVAINAIQELSAQIEELKLQVEELRQSA